MDAWFSRPPAADASLWVSTAGSQTTPRDQNPEAATIVYGQAYPLYWAGRYAQAHKLLLTGANPADQVARLWYYKGLAEIGLGRDDAAIESRGKSVRLQTPYPKRTRQINAALERGALLPNVDTPGQVKRWQPANSNSAGRPPWRKASGIMSEHFRSRPTPCRSPQVGGSIRHGMSALRVPSR